MTTTTPNEFRVGATVHGRDEDLGEVAALVFDPVTGEVSHLVVEDGASASPRLTPIDTVAQATGDDVHLSLTTDQFHSLPSFVQSRYQRGPGRHAITDADMQHNFLAPFVLPLDGWQFATEERVPAGEAALYLGTPVVDCEGHHLGQVDELVVDPADHQVTHLVLSRRHLFKREKVTVPLAAVDHYGDAVHLNVTKDQLESSEAVPLGESPGRFDEN